MKSSRPTLAWLLALNAPLAWATDPQSIDIGDLELVPTLTLRESYDDNYRGLSDNERSSWVTSIRPTVQLKAEKRKSAYMLRYAALADVFHDDSDASNTDHHLTLRSAMEFAARHRLDWGLGYHRIEQTIDSEVALENDKYSRSVADASYTFGARSARNQLQFGSAFEAWRSRNSGSVNADEDRDSTTVNGIWFHRIGGRTRSLLELRRTEHEYKASGSYRDATDTAALVGVTMDASARTSGSARIGYERKNFDDNSRRDDFASPMWEVDLAWQPRTYSTFSLETRQAYSEGDEGAYTIHGTTTRLGWEHAWTSRISSELFYRFGQRDYEGIDRDDDLTAYGLGLTWSPDRWIDLSLGYRHSNNDSSRADETYDRNVYLLSLDLSL